MCSEKMIERVLNGYAATYNKKGSLSVEDGKATGFHKDVYHTWVSVLSPYNDQIVWLAYLDVVAKSWTYPPNIGDIRDQCSEIVKRMKLDVQDNRQYCEDCREHRGIIYTHAGYYRTDLQNKWIVSTRVCRCTCDDSKETHPDLMTADRRRQLLEGDDRVDLQQYLATDRDNTSYSCDLIDPVGFEKRTANNTTNKYQRVLDIIMSGNGHLLFQSDDHNRQSTMYRDSEEDSSEDTRWEDSYDGYDDNPFNPSCDY